MTVRKALSESQTALRDCGTETPRLDTSLLLSHALGITREKLFMGLSDELEKVSLETFRSLMQRRNSGEPIAWIIGVKEFWGLEFSVGPGVLCPRPDSEILIESALEVMDNKTEILLRSGRLHDCGTGPGTLALTLAHERPSWHISASDISEKAAGYFRENNRKITHSRVTYVHADLMAAINGTFDIIVSNPPYLTPGETTERLLSGWQEPEMALNGGGMDGLFLIRRLIPQMTDHLSPNGTILLEADPFQMPIIKKILLDTGYINITLRQDLASRNRVIVAHKEP